MMLILKNKINQQTQKLSQLKLSAADNMPGSKDDSDYEDETFYDAEEDLYYDSIDEDEDDLDLKQKSSKAKRPQTKKNPSKKPAKRSQQVKAKKPKSKQTKRNEQQQAHQRSPQSLLPTMWIQLSSSHLSNLEETSIRITTSPSLQLQQYSSVFTGHPRK
jgi:hypothetical protein